MWIILLLPFIGLLWLPFYNSLEPSWLGVPFFYWYQLLWVSVTAFLTWLVLPVITTPREKNDGRLDQLDRPLGLRFLLLVTVMGFAAARWQSQGGKNDDLHESPTRPACAPPR